MNKDAALLKARWEEQARAGRAVQGAAASAELHGRELVPLRQAKSRPHPSALSSQKQAPWQTFSRNWTTKTMMVMIKRSALNELSRAVPL